MANSPICTLRDGRLKVTVWQNDSGNGNNQSKNSFYTASLVKSYQNDNGDWQETNSLTGNEMLRASKLLERAYNQYHVRVDNPDR